MSADGFLPYGRQHIDDDDIAAVVEVLRSDWLTQGPSVTQFESAVAEYCGVRHAVACNNGTAALHLAMLAAGLGDGDTVITSPNTFLASANCARYVGAAVRFADIDPATANMSANALQEQLAMHSGGRVAVIPVHFGGTPCPMPAIEQVARAADAVIVEDACHAIGARYRDEGGKWVTAGSCRHSDMTVFSFHPVKHITTGEGGMVTTNDDRLVDRLRMFRNHGMVRDPERFTDREAAFQSGEVAPWYYEMQELGYNFRITDLQCALGVTQLKKLSGFVARRREIAQRYRDAFRSVPHIGMLTEPEGFEGSYHLFVLQIDFDRLGVTRSQMMRQLRERGIGTQVHYIPVHLQPYYRKQFGTGPGMFPAAEAYYAQALSIPMYPDMTDTDVDRVADAVREVAGV
ncbi:MAG: UDP-4-amino-4,6-dideoxy-N-acetyl-beta-L-altrosamine transaminase [Nitrospirota bacterium]|nr:UDP-4-amino-4,6-dideoxy-N-acetyl-beta-L-altrosamine transaminase [Nitrospirota bacterium]